MSTRKTDDPFPDRPSDASGLLAEQLREARREMNRIKSVLRSCPDCVVTFNQEDTILGFNPAAERTFGYRREEVLGRKLAELLFTPRLQFQYRNDLARNLDSPYSSTWGQRREFSAVRANGEEFPCELTLTRTDPEDGPAFFTAFIRDLTERKNSERNLRESENRFRALFEQSPVSIQRFLPNGVSLQANRAFEELFGLTNDDLIRTGFNLLKDPQLAASGVAPLIQKAFEGEAVTTPPQLYSARVSVGLGRAEPRWLRSNLYPLKDPGGAIREVIVILEDVTEHIAAENAIRQLNRDLEARIAERTEALEAEIEERKITEGALQASEQRVRDILEMQVEVVSRYTPEGVNTYLSPAHRDLFGPQSYIGTNWIEQMPADVAKVIREKISALTPEDPIFESVNPRRLRDDREIWEHWINRGIFDSTGKLVEVQSTGREITRLVKTEQALKESERKFRALFEGSLAGVVLLDEITIVDVNPAWLEMLGYTSREQVVGRSILEFSAPVQGDGESAATVAQRMGRKRSEALNARFEWTCVKADGSEIPVEVYSSTVLVEGREIAQAILHDISERKQIEREMLKALERERELGQLKSNFISMVSHEYRNPLGIILSSTQLLKNYFDRLSPDDRLESLRDIETSTRRMSEMIDDMLLMGKANAGKLELAPDSLNLVEFCTTLIDETRSSQNTTRVVKLTHEGIDRPAISDEQILRLILGNLLGNALKYSPPSLPVTLHVRRAETNAIFTLHDDGIGIPLADQPQLFQAFRRAKNVGLVSGTGLGLFIVKHCVDLHHGDIQFESAEGKGTTVTVTLPLFPEPVP